MALILVVEQQSTLLLWPQPSYRSYVTWVMLLGLKTTLYMMLSSSFPASKWMHSQLLFRMGVAWGISPIGRALHRARRISCWHFVNGGERCFSKWVFLRGFVCALLQAQIPAPFPTRRYSSFAVLFDEFAAEKGVTSVYWGVSSGQPYCLEALRSLSRLLSDKDVALFPALSQGVPTGYDKDIPASNVFAPRPSDAQPDAELQICEGNWVGAEADTQLLLKLVQSELDAGYLLEVPLDKALATWGSKVAVGKMNIVHSEGREPRLVVDDSVLQYQCFVPRLRVLQQSYIGQCTGCFSSSWTS